MAKYVLNSHLSFARYFILAENNRSRSSPLLQAATRWQIFYKTNLTNKMKKIIFTFTLFLIGIKLSGQTITINKATIDREIIRQANDEVLVRGIIDIEYEIKNNTKDTVLISKFFLIFV